MAFRIIPREEKFFSDFLSMADLIQTASALLAEMLATDPPVHSKAAEIKEVEHRCDFLTREVLQRLNRTFVTPIDREDIHSIAGALDDVLDSIDAAAALIPIYKIETVRFGARELAAIIVRQAAELTEACRALEGRKGVVPRTEAINKLEHEADVAHQSAVGRLFDEERDPIAVMKWKEILDTLEDATDRCEDVANLLENVVVKHG